MKKIIRIASVIALACASLVYVGCTKDFSADIAKTNSDVSALKSKVDALDATVQTINSTVANLQTTKADLSKVEELDAAIKSALEKKIGELEESLKKTAGDASAAAADAAAAKTDAAAAQTAADAVAEDLKKANAKLDTVIADVKNVADSLDIVAANVKALRADVDSLQNWQGKIDDAIETLTGRVDALAARITSIVAVPSMNAEFRHFVISDKDTTFFATTFAVTPKAAVKNIDAKDLKVNFKKGLTREVSAPLDTTCIVSKVVADEAKGEITVFVPFKRPDNFPTTTGTSAVYFSLAFAGKDEAEADYEVNSEYVKAHENEDEINNNNLVIVKNGKELTADDYELRDTLAFNSPNGTKFASLFKGIDVAFKFNNELISKEDIAILLDTTFVVKIDTASLDQFNPEGQWLGEYPNDTTLGIVVTKNEGTKIFNATKDNVGWCVGVEVDSLIINDHGVFIDANDHNKKFFENHVVGAKTVEYTLPSVTEPWTYTSCEKVSRTVSITDCEDVHNAIPEAGITEGAFKITQNSGNGVDIAVTNALRNPEAKDTVYNVAFKHNVETLGPNDTVNFTINWKYTLEGRPADETIALANVDTLANDYTKSLEVAIDSNIVAETFAAFDAAYDKTIDTTVVKNAIKAKTSAINTANVYFEGDTLDPWTVSNGKVVVPALTKAGAYEVELEAKVFGIKYTYTYTINLEWKEALKLHATPYVSAHEAIVDADTTDASGVYTLKKMDMAKYLQVFNHDTLAKNFSGYNVVFHYELEDSTKFEIEDETVVINDVVFDTTALAVTNGILASRELDWNGYNGREVEITAYLVNAQDTVDTYTFTLKYRKPITSFAAGTQEVKRVAGVDTTVVLDKAMVIKGLYNGEKNLIVDTTGAWINGKNYYSCEIAYDIEKASFKVNGESTIFAPDVDYVFTPATNANAPETATIKFIGDNNNTNIEASIPVVLTYKYDYNHVEAYKDNVVIKVVNE